MTKRGLARRALIGIGVLIAVQGAALALYLLLRHPAREEVFDAQALAPRSAPALTFTRADGSRHTLAELRGKVVMVHFWATWCEPCRKELPGLLVRARELSRTGRFELLAVSVGDEWSEIREFFDGSVPGEVARPDDADVHRRFGVLALPDTYLVDGRGDVFVRYGGARDWRSAAARAQLERMIGSR